MPVQAMPDWAKDGEKLGEVRGRIAQILREPDPPEGDGAMHMLDPLAGWMFDPLAGLPAQAKKALASVGADAPLKIARALQYRLVTRQTRGVGDITYRKIERWLEGRGIVRVSEEENFFVRGEKKPLT